jgi:hypothetical protein
MLQREIDDMRRRHRWGFLQLSGNHNLDSSAGFDMRLGIHSPAWRWLNLQGGYSQERFESEINNITSIRYTTAYNLSWRPNVKWTNFGLAPGVGFSHINFKTESSHAEIPTSHRRNTSILRGDVSITSNPINTNIFRVFKINYRHVSWKEERQTIFEDDVFILPLLNNTFNEFDVSVSFQDFLFSTGTDINFYYYHERAHFETNIYFNNRILPILALNVQYSDIILPSIKFGRAFQVNNWSDVAISNTPGLLVQSIYEFYDFHPFREIQKFNYLTQAPFKFSIAYNVYRPIEIQLNYKIHYLRNMHYFGHHNCDCNQWCSGQYWMTSDSLKHIFSLDLRKKVNNFVFSGNLAYTMTDLINNYQDSVILFRPNFTGTLTAGYNRNRFNANMSGTLFTGIHSISESVAQTEFHLSAGLSYDLFRNFRIGLNANNLLDSSFTPDSIMQTNGRNLEVFATVRF